MGKSEQRLYTTPKLVAFLLAASLIPLLVAGSSSYLVSRTAVQNEARQHSAELVYSQREYLDLKMQEIESLVANISSMGALNEVLAESSAASANDPLTHARVSYLLGNYTHLKGLVSIDLFTLDGAHYHVGDPLNGAAVDAPLQQSVYQGAMQADNRIYWPGIEDNLNSGSGFHKVISAASILKRFDLHTLRSEPAALLVVSYSVLPLYEHFHQLSLSPGSLLTVLDRQQRVLYHPDAAQIGLPSTLDFLAELKGEQGVFFRQVNGKASIVTYSRSPGSGWAVIHVVPTGALAGQTSGVSAAALITFALMLPLVTLAAWRFSRRVTAPIHTVSRRLEQLAGGEPGGERTVETGEKEELAGLVSSFNAFLPKWQEKRRAEEALRASEERFRSLVEHSGGWMWLTNMAGRLVYSSPNVQAILGYSPQEIAGKKPADLILPEQAQRFEDAIHQAMAKRERLASLEITFLHKQGRRLVCEVNGAVLLDRAGRPTGFGGACHDITERKAAEAALRESEERYTLATRGANDGIWDWDLHANCIYYSPRWKTLIGYEESEISDSPSEWFGRVHPDDIDRLKVELTAHLDGASERFESEHRLFHRSGRYHWVMVIGLAERDNSNRAHRIAGSLTDISARKMTEERLRHDAMHDPLTNLPNRTYFIDQLRRSMERVRRHTDYLSAVLFMDLDRFKIVNDSLGHQSGDAMLLAISQRLESCLRAGDVVARFGGDEFAVLLEDMNGINDAILVANRIQKELALPFVLQGVEVFTSVSIGIALTAASYTRPEDLLRDADTAMYRAKAAGRARYQVFDTEMHARSLALLQMEAELRRAIEREEFELHYQPVVSLNGGQITTVEALLRWNHPTRGTLYPKDFVPLAEETGLIVPIGAWVLRTACTQLKNWRESGHPALKMAINVSGRQFQDFGFREQLQKVLCGVGLPGSALQLEITESAAMQDFDLTTQTIQDLRRMGIYISIDDFGSNYSSLGYLKRYPVSSIKIDQTFIQHMVDDVDNAAITTAIIAIGHVLNLNVIAEGVETQKQLDFLAAQNCDEIQGYFLDHPMPAAEFTERLSQGQFLPARPDS